MSQTDRDQEVLKGQAKLHDEDIYESLSQLFKMFADPTRLRIFSVIAHEPVCVDDLSRILNMSQSAISHQLASLRKMNLVKSTKRGQRAYYELKDDHVMMIFNQALEHVKE